MSFATWQTAFAYSPLTSDVADLPSSARRNADSDSATATATAVVDGSCERVCTTIALIHPLHVTSLAIDGTSIDKVV